MDEDIIEFGLYVPAPASPPFPEANDGYGLRGPDECGTESKRAMPI